MAELNPHGLRDDEVARLILFDNDSESGRTVVDIITVERRKTEKASRTEFMRQMGALYDRIDCCEGDQVEITMRRAY